MDCGVVHGTLEQAGADTWLVGVPQGAERPEGALAAADTVTGGAVHEVLSLGDVRGAVGEVTVLYARGEAPVRRVVLTGLGPAESLDAERLRRAAAAAVRRARRLGAQRLATTAFPLNGLDAALVAQATVEGCALAWHRSAQPGVQPSPAPAPLELHLAEADADRLAAVRDGVRVAEAGVEGVLLARELVDTPPNVATPRRLGEVALELGTRPTLHAAAHGPEWIEAHRMQLLSAVGRASREPSRFLTLEHRPDAAGVPTVVLVGKGVTFDSGGLTMKSKEGMATMKADMAGAAAVLGAVAAAARLELPVHLVALAPCVENAVGGGAYRPSDVLTAGDGTTVEIVSTDAEGRLALAEALVHARRFRPSAVIDVATLTGATVTALGRGVASALYGNDEALRERLLAAAQRSGERLWPMPSYPDYRERLASTAADLKNSAERDGAGGLAAAFLEHFAEGPWAHLDIAPTAWTDRDDGYVESGGTGVMVRTLLEVLRSW